MSRRIIQVVLDDVCWLWSVLFQVVNYLHSQSQCLHGILLTTQLILNHRSLKMDIRKSNASSHFDFRKIYSVDANGFRDFRSGKSPLFPFWGNWRGFVNHFAIRRADGIHVNSEILSRKFCEVIEPHPFH